MKSIISIMIRIYLPILAALFFYSCQSNQKKTQSEKEPKPEAVKEASWQSLFDGQTKNGWHVYNGKSDGSAWEAKDGVLHLNPKEIMVTPVPGAGDLTQAVDGGDLASDEEYENFHLKLDWKVGSPSNSGVMIFVQEVPKHDYPWQTGPEVQLMEQRECNEDINCVGDLYSLVAGPRDLKILDDWNSLEIIANRGSLEVIMNGRQLYATTMWDDNWRAMIAKTKFTYWPDFGTFKKGKIVLQDHGHPVWYRNIAIKKL